MSYKNALLWQSFYTSLLGILCYTPCKIVHVFLEELPGTTKVLCDVQFFVNFAWIISEFTAISPGSSKSPLLLSGVELELVNLFARVETSNISSTVFSYPVNSMSANENNEIVIDRALKYLGNESNHLITIFDFIAGFSHHFL
jgi:hypothetical protein